MRRGEIGPDCDGQSLVRETACSPPREFRLQPWYGWSRPMPALLLGRTALEDLGSAGSRIGHSAHSRLAVPCPARFALRQRPVVTARAPEILFPRRNALLPLNGADCP